MPFVYLYAPCLDELVRQQLEGALRFLVAAAVNSPDGPVAPEDVESQVGEMPVPAAVAKDPKGIFVDIEARFTMLRAVDPDKRAKSLKDALDTLMPGCNFTVKLRLTNFGWASDEPDVFGEYPTVDMNAAVQHARALLPPRLF